MHELNFNKNRIELGYGKLVGKEGKESSEILVAGLNPSHNRFKNLKHPFDADMKSEKNNDGKTFIKFSKRKIPFFRRNMNFCNMNIISILF